MRGICVYTVLYRKALEFMLKRWPPDKPAWFSSGRRWRTAAKQVPMPVLIRAISDEDHGPPVCSYLAELTEVRFLEQIGKDQAERRDWLLKHKALQRAQRETNGWPDEKFQEKEIDLFVDYETHFAIRGLRRIKPIPLEHLTKFRDGRPLSPKYRYGYVLCVYPAPRVKIGARR